MKISEITTEQLVDTLVVLVDPFTSIVTDIELVDGIKDKMGLNGTESTAEMMVVGAQKISKIAPILLKNHKNDIYSILSAINGVSIEQVAKQSALKTIKELKELLTDKDLLSFFRQSAE
jgi:DNA polymerase III epsilon subunit-like protein